LGKLAPFYPGKIDFFECALCKWTHRSGFRAADPVCPHLGRGRADWVKPCGSGQWPGRRDSWPFSRSKAADKTTCSWPYSPPLVARAGTIHSVAVRSSGRRGAARSAVRAGLRSGPARGSVGPAPFGRSGAWRADKRPEPELSMRRGRDNAPKFLRSSHGRGRPPGIRTCTAVSRPESRASDMPDRVSHCFGRREDDAGPARWYRRPLGAYKPHVSGAHARNTRARRFFSMQIESFCGA
jgi:hypothetical protein